MIFLLAIPAGVLTNLAVRGVGEDGWTASAFGSVVVLLFAALDLTGGR